MTTRSDSRFSVFRGSRVAVTGGIGLIVSALARRLVELGAQVLLIDSMVPEAGGNFANIATIRDRVRVNIADIRQQSTMNYLVRDRDVKLRGAVLGDEHVV